MKRLALYFAVAYLTVVGYFYFRQAKLLFPAPREFAKTDPSDVGLQFEDLRIPVNGTEQIHAWWIPAARPDAKVIVAFHGNGYVLEDMVSSDLPSLHATGAHLLLIDYRGYGSSTQRSPDEESLNADAAAALSFLLQRRKAHSLNEVVALGRSIGTGPATYLASRNPGLGGLILESPFTSIDDAARRVWYFRVFPVGLLLRTHLNNASRMDSIQMPLLIVSGSIDELTPIDMAESLLARARGPKQLYRVAGAGHNDLVSVGGYPLTRVLQQFIQ